MLVGLFKTILAPLDPTVDQASWQFVFQSDEAVSWSGISPVIAAVHGFLTDPPPTFADTVGKYISPVMDRTADASIVEVYNITAHLDGTPHGSPVAMGTFTLPGASSNPGGLPEACAAVFSFRADYGTDVEFGPHTRPRARDRNRVYVGPLTMDAIDLGSGAHHAKLDPTYIARGLKALQVLSSTVHDGAGNAWNFRVWSRVNAGVKLPTVGWMDDRVDYQRRRSDPSPASRTSIALASA